MGITWLTSRKAAYSPVNTSPFSAPYTSASSVMAPPIRGQLSGRRSSTMSPICTINPLKIAETTTTKRPKRSGESGTARSASIRPGTAFAACHTTATHARTNAR